MGEGPKLYADAKSDCQTLVDFLLGFAVQQVNERGSFLPFAAALDTSGEVQAHAAHPGPDPRTSAEVLPLLHEALRPLLASGMRAVAVCEWVRITPVGGHQTDAAKVLVEHSNGLSVAFYLPMTKRLFGKWKTGELVVQPVQPEIGA